MATIGTDTFVKAPTADKYCLYGTEHYARPLDIGNDWTDFRIGALLSIDPDGTNNITSASFVLGLCSGKANPFGAATTTNFIGARFGAPSTLTYQAGSGNPYYNNSGSGQVHTIKKVGGTVTTASHANISRGLPTSNGSVKRRWPVLVRIVKGSPNWTVYAHIPTGAPSDPSIDFSDTEFISALENTATLNDIDVNGLNLESSNASVAMDEVAGIIDSFNLYWNRGGFPLRNYILKGFRFA